jgi:cytochrome oxidase Cu insertion factor (SCO1/SenC/PrrC family)
MSPSRRARFLIWPADPGCQPASRSRPRTRRVLALVAACAALLTGVASYLLVSQREQQAALLRPAGIPPSVSTQLADLMQLSPVQSQAAPGFTLTDQHGRTLSLASLRGHAVVLEFMDLHCTDICPIVSAEFIDAYHDLGGAVARAVFVAVNVNPYYRSTGAIAAYTREHGLATIPSWHFLTGTLAGLRAIWRAYGIVVEAPSRNADVIHTSEMFFIDPAGQERYVAAPADDHTAAGNAYLPAGQLADWGQGIALVTRQLTP